MFLNICFFYPRIKKVIIIIIFIIIIIPKAYLEPFQTSVMEQKNIHARCLTEL